MNIINWQTFWYNFNWADYSRFLNGRSARISTAIPILGYAVLFNDYVIERIDFKELTGSIQTHFLASGDLRFRLMFLGAFFIAIANIFYRIRRPSIMRLGETKEAFYDYAFKYFTFRTLSMFHLEIKRSGFDPWTPDGKYYDADWDSFRADAVLDDGGKRMLPSDRAEAFDRISSVNFAEAKRKHEDLIRSILRETYFARTRVRRKSLLFCIFIFFCGFTMLLVPGLDLCARVIEVTIWEPVSRAASQFLAGLSSSPQHPN
ncbi:hypothetical protein [Psychromarinibacter sp. S121]|uniref:hypothetical protein n=1 Tax=Psychromarinibacter sp. S121 TaxID=3415127 RepID=UPI003C7E42D5